MFVINGHLFLGIQLSCADCASRSSQYEIYLLFWCFNLQYSVLVFKLKNRLNKNKVIGFFSSQFYSNIFYHDKHSITTKTHFWTINGFALKCLRPRLATFWAGMRHKLITFYFGVADSNIFFSRLINDVMMCECVCVKKKRKKKEWIERHKWHRSICCMWCSFLMKNKMAVFIFTSFSAASVSNSTFCNFSKIEESEPLR